MDKSLIDLIGRFDNNEVSYYRVIDREKNSMCEEHALQIHTEMRDYNFKGIFNFRDMGGYKIPDSRRTAWRRLYRSGELHQMSRHDFQTLKWDIKPVTVIDLRDREIVELNGTGRVQELGVTYHNIPLTNETEEEEAQDEHESFTDSRSEILYHIEKKDVGQRILEILTLMADTKNYPLIFHCNAGKKRTGIIAMIILGILGVSDEDIVNDYALSAPQMEKIRDRMLNDPAMADVIKETPEYAWRVDPEDIRVPLMEIKEKYGSVRGFLKTRGADDSLFERLEAALLEWPQGTEGYSE